MPDPSVPLLEWHTATKAISFDSKHYKYPCNNILRSLIIFSEQRWTVTKYISLSTVLEFVSLIILMTFTSLHLNNKSHTFYFNTFLPRLSLLITCPPPLSQMWWFLCRWQISQTVSYLGWVMSLCCNSRNKFNGTNCSFPKWSAGRLPSQDFKLCHICWAVSEKL